ncbi:aflatoxin B1-aldehyde reductase [Crepidotus variabilis]|uniref:Aflatoxin B1-aldehyde reductase n=1 Tax=Crepidotus variabilis TaxID=179855 RepID=A0A9P6JLT1_9AGAR|nr:aflatoxin B1-aldehyde reductase [Crepidotus variabilis]
MSFSTRIPVIYGGGGIGDPGTFCKLTSVEAAQPIFDTWYNIVGPSAIDTSDLYGHGTSEPLIGKMNLHGSGVDTKCYPTTPGAHSYENVKKAVNSSVQKLQGIKIRVFYLHAPDRTVDWKETLRAINELHQEGKFEAFGLSNFYSYEVAEIVMIARQNGWVQPTVYEGIYNPIDRSVETELIPCLRRYNIRFAAYCPLAGGLLVGHLLSDSDELASIEPGSHYDAKQPFGRWFSSRYGPMVPEVRKLKEAAEKSGLNLNQASVRWLQHHSALLSSDFGIIFGGSKTSHVETTLKYCTEGPLPDELVQAFETCYANVKAGLPNYNHNPPWYNPKEHGY